MLRTEEEANKRWCPMSKPNENDYCIASKCMMWRLGFELELKYPYKPLDHQRGYCGLAGTPNAQTA